MRFNGPNLPPEAQDRPLLRALVEDMRRIASHLKSLSTGRISAQDAYPSAPTSGQWEDGDFVRNSSPAELGSASSKYVVLGWVRISGSWYDVRTLTGN